MKLESTSQIQARANLIGAAWMIAAMAGFAVEDAFLKAAAQSVPVGLVLMVFGAVGTLVFGVIARAQGDALVNADVLGPVMRFRFVFEMTGRLFHLLAIALTPLSSATAILQATPIVVVLGAVVAFNEKVGPTRWFAIFAGLFGVLIILQPTGDSFSPLSLLAVIGMLGFAMRDLASRAAPATLSTSVLGVYGFLAILVVGAVFAAWEGIPLAVPNGRAWLFLAGGCLFGVLGYASLMKAMRTGDVASVAPFRYARLLFGLALGIFAFGESLNATTLIGCAIVVGSGLLILSRGR